MDHKEKMDKGWERIIEITEKSIKDVQTDKLMKEKDSVKPELSHAAIDTIIALVFLFFVGWWLKWTIWGVVEHFKHGGWIIEKCTSQNIHAGQLMSASLIAIFLISGFFQVLFLYACGKLDRYLNKFIEPKLKWVYGFINRRNNE